jgi:hypothetical protein
MKQDLIFVDAKILDACAMGIQNPLEAVLP